MTFHICGQCQFFLRDSHPEDEDQTGECGAMPPQLIVFEGEVLSMRPTIDPACTACAIFRENKR